MRGSQFQQHSIFVLVTFSLHFSFLLTHKYFIFDNKFHHHIKGTAMGMYGHRRMQMYFLGGRRKLFFFFLHKLHYYQDRYFDDILILGMVKSHFLFEFVPILNNNYIGMRFTLGIHEKEFNFLNLRISMDSDVHIYSSQKYIRYTNSFLH